LYPLLSDSGLVYVTPGTLAGHNTSTTAKYVEHIYGSSARTKLRKSKKSRSNNPLRTIDGNASDKAIFQFVERFVDIDQIREKYPKVLEVPFNSKNKWMLTIHRLEGCEGSDALLIMKGASENMVYRSSHVLTRDGPKKLTKHSKQELEHTYST